MIPLERRRARSLLAIAAVTLLLATGCGKDTGSATPSDAAYVAMGDSSAAGAGIAPVADEDCARSTRNYPSLLAERLDLTLADVTCGGAETENLEKPRETDDWKRAPQLDALSSKTRLVTLGIGLNDFKLAYTLLYLCIPASGKLSDDCETYLDQPAAGFGPYLDGIEENVTTAIETIRKQAPKARIVLVDYPRYAPDAGACPDRLPLPTDATERARTVIAEVSTRYREIAEETGVLFADMYSASAGHDVCSADPWVHGWVGSAGEGAEMHPFPAYHRAVADRIADLLGK